MTDDNDGAWFGRRGYGKSGYGYHNLPLTWQGWAATILYSIGTILCFFVPALMEVPHGGLVSFAAFAPLTLVFGYVCARKSRRRFGR